MTTAQQQDRRLSRAAHTAAERGVRQDLDDLLATSPPDAHARSQARAQRRRVVEEARARAERAMHALLEAIRIAEWHYATLAHRLEAHHQRAATVESRLRAEGYLR